MVVTYTPEPGAVICLGRDVPEGWETRTVCEDGAWEVDAAWHMQAIVEARPVPVPPVAVEIPRDLADRIVRMWDGYVSTDGSLAGAIVSLVKAAL